VVKILPAIVLVLSCAGCQQHTPRGMEKHRARIAVAETFSFAIIVNSGAEPHNSAPPPARVKPAGGSALFSAPQPLPPRWRLFRNRRRAKHH